jgi:glycosyltransferase involved in cell wall biosynthesis
MRSASGMRTIAFDTWCLNGFVRNNGVYVYAAKLLEQLREVAPQHGVDVAPYVCASADNDANLLPEGPNFKPRETALLRWNRLWRFGGAWALAASQQADLVFRPHSTTLDFGGSVPSVVTIHDAIPKRMRLPSRRITATLRFCISSSARFSRAIITVSQHSKKDLVELYGIPESKIFVVYNGCDQSIFNPAAPDRQCLSDLLSRFGISGPYILHHGAIKPNKNLKRLIQAYRRLRDRNRNLELQLVLAGPLDRGCAEVLATASIGPIRPVVTGPLDIHDLALLIKGASLAVFPSLYEGFCLPMIEAMACGIPVIAANGSCMPEISGGVLRYFNPESVDEMSACIEDALENGELRRELADRGRAWASRFNWRRCAEETLGVLKRQLGEE